MTEEDRFTKSIFDNALKVIRDPAAFFRQMPREGGFGAPVIFLAAMVFLGLIVNLIGAALIIRPHNLGGGLIMLIAAPVIMVLLSFVSAAVLFLIWRIIGSKQSYETAYRCMAYSCGILPVTSAISFIPFAGVVLSTLWGAYLIISASIHVHGIKPAKAWAVWGIIAVIFIGINLSAEMGSRYAARNMVRQRLEMQKLQDNAVKEMQKAKKEMYK
ncbi:MAG TPA: YIP1 family protein [Nitrospirae bacterium]|nr:Yip1 domain protein [bacterium BMS3Bbin05]HDO36398.1 YIP1 family protein [Nitrospirota bacterium]